MNGTPVVCARGLHKRFGAAQVLEGVSLSLPPGAVYGLVGRNGIGKTTLLRVLMGLEIPEQGESQLLGTPSRQLDRATLAQIGYHAHGLGLFSSLSLAEHCDYFGPGYPTWDSDYARALASRLEVSWHGPVESLSSGDRQKAGLVLTLAPRPRLLILDEPAANLDVVVRHAMVSLLVDHVADTGASILIASHLLTDLERLVDRVGVLRDPCTLFEASLDRLKESVVRLRIAFERDPPPDFSVPFEVRRDGAGRDLLVAVSRIDRRFLAELRSVAQVEVIPLCLEEIFVALTERSTQDDEARRVDPMERFSKC